MAVRSMLLGCGRSCLRSVFLFECDYEKTHVGCDELRCLRWQECLSFNTAAV